jgi:TetR/AcrR family transcriptional regulator, tetracycline repressor protein
MVARRSGREAPPSSAPLTRERVCREALALVDEEGLDALSMRRLGARLGVEAMSLYRHVRHKADLLDALHAAVLGELDAPAPTGDWRASLRGMASALRAALIRHPSVIPLFATRPVAAPEAMLLVQAAWEGLERAGFSAEDARRVIIVVGVFTLGHLFGEAHGEPAPHLGAPEKPGSTAFDFGLDVILDGLATRLPQKRERAARAH